MPVHTLLNMPNNIAYFTKLDYQIMKNRALSV